MDLGLIEVWPFRTSAENDSTLLYPPEDYGFFSSATDIGGEIHGELNITESEQPYIVRRSIYVDGYVVERNQLISGYPSLDMHTLTFELAEYLFEITISVIYLSYSQSGHVSQSTGLRNRPTHITCQTQSDTFHLKYNDDRFIRIVLTNRPTM